MKEFEKLCGFRCVRKKATKKKRRWIWKWSRHALAWREWGLTDREHAAPNKTSLRFPADSASNCRALLTATTLTSSWHTGKTTTFYNFQMARGLAGDTSAENAADNRWLNVCQDMGRGRKCVLDTWRGFGFNAAYFDSLFCISDIGEEGGRRADTSRPPSFKERCTKPASEKERKELQGKSSVLLGLWGGGGQKHKHFPDFLKLLSHRPHRPLPI